MVEARPKEIIQASNGINNCLQSINEVGEGAEAGEETQYKATWNLFAMIERKVKDKMTSFKVWCCEFKKVRSLMIQGSKT